ncbi:MAG: sugar phosphate isomerase/epimerase, partial [Rhodospirillales bacterium]|nr:sugar phosphate isomerase/epimerase [Rhodospirillales bacterium]
VTIGFEFHGYARCSINNLATASAALEALGDRRVGLVVDAFHFYVGGSSLEELGRSDGSRILIVHLADVDHADRATLGKANRVLPGEGVLPLRALVEQVRRAGYRGPFSLELFREEFWAMDPSVVARRGIEAMRGVVNGADPAGAIA